VIAARPPPEKAQPAPPQRQAAPAAVLPPPVKRAPPTPGLSPEDQARAERMLAQGSRHLDQGNISAARMFFQRAAEAGLAAGALSMGGTYDPVELGRLESLGLNADRNEARKWYERARDLGAPEAADRLGRLR
jgi:TPR repeat protein